MKTVAIANLKGGVGKTTITQNLAGVLQERGHRVLLLDMDHQANLTSVFENGASGEAKGMAQVLFDGLPFPEAIHTTTVDGIWIVPADIDLAFVDARFGNDLNAHFQLAELLASQADRFDYTLIDCPPNLGLGTRMALVAADGYLVPVDAHRFSYKGAQHLEQVVANIRRRANPNLKFLGYVLNRIQSRRRVTENYIEHFKEQFQTRLLETQIKESIRYQEASTAGQPITIYQPNSDGAEVFRQLAQEIGL